MPEKRLEKTREAYDAFEVEAYLAARRLPNMVTVNAMTIQEASKRIADWVDANALRDVYGKVYAAVK